MNKRQGVFHILAVWDFFAKFVGINCTDFFIHYGKNNSYC